MTRFLSQALGAHEPAFSQSIQRLEQATGAPSADIRLTSEIVQGMRQKIITLGLDPDDTTAQELYGALHHRLSQDEQKVRTALHIAGDDSANDIMASVLRFVRIHGGMQDVFVLKASVAKRMLRKRPPKLAMKRLGYRSIESMLKHEGAAELYAAAVMVESDTWQRNFREAYQTLTPSDFESRSLQLQNPTSQRWQELAEEYVAKGKHPILSFPELGSIVVLPMNHLLDGLAIVTMLLIGEEMNGIRSHSSYAKLQQVKPNFGALMQKSAVSEPFTSAELAGQPVPWRMIQRYYGRFTDAYHPEVFEPHVQADDLTWLPGERALARLEPSLAFWRDSQCLGFLHNGEVVSCNALDVALSYCNHLPFHSRVVHFLRDNMWHELMMRYLHQDNLEAAVHSQLSAELEQPLAFAEQEAI